jgi:hypothetical protein
VLKWKLTSGIELILGERVASQDFQDLVFDGGQVIRQAYGQKTNPRGGT